MSRRHYKSTGRFCGRHVRRLRRTNPLEKLLVLHLYRYTNTAGSVFSVFKQEVLSLFYATGVIEPPFAFSYNITYAQKFQ